MAVSKKDQYVALSPTWQWTFTAITIVGYLAYMALFLSTMIGAHFYSRGTFIFQTSLWAFPVVLFLVAFGFVWRGASLRKKLFAASLLSWLSYSVYQLCAQAMDQIRGHFFVGSFGGNNPGLWYDFGWDWSLMIIILALYVAFLYWHRRSIRKLL